MFGRIFSLNSISIGHVCTGRRLVIYVLVWDQDLGWPDSKHFNLHVIGNNNIVVTKHSNGQSTTLSWPLLAEDGSRSNTYLTVYTFFETISRAWRKTVVTKIGIFLY